MLFEIRIILSTAKFKEAGQNGTATKWHGRQNDTVRHFGTVWHFGTESQFGTATKFFKFIFFSKFILGF